MAGSKRERELHRAKLARQQKEAAAASERRRRRLQIGGAIGGVLIVIIAIAGVAVATNSDDKSTPTATPSNAPSVAPTNTSGVTCKPVNDKKPLTKQYDKFTPSLIDGAKYTQNMDTNCGRIVFTMDSTAAPKTTNAMAFLADNKYFDNTKCHRLTTGGGNFVLQCGDPTGTGSGSPGFSVPDENLPTGAKDANGSVVYPRGTVAMANAGPGTTGSQFFIVYGDSTFPPNYTVLGSVTEGMNIVDYVASKGTLDGSADGAPKQPLQITKMVSSAAIEQQAPTQ